MAAAHVQAGERHPEAQVIGPGFAFGRIERHLVAPARQHALLRAPEAAALAEHAAGRAVQALKDLAVFPHVGHGEVKEAVHHFLHIAHGVVDLQRARFAAADG